jgi:hypothetical protein
MRLTTSLVALAFVAAALPGGAQSQGLPPPPRVQRVPPPPPQPPPPGTWAPAPYPRTVPAPPQPQPYGYAYHPQHFWWGWGWGWGWYPLYGYPAPPPPVEGHAPRPPQEADRIYTRFSLYGAGSTDGYVGGLDFGLDGHYLGFDMDVNAIAQESVTGPLHESESDPAAWGTAHVTWSIVSERSIRLRIETGGSMLSLPESRFVAGQPWSGSTIFGPDVGISGQFGLIGPLGIEGHARLTPFPVRVADTLIAATIHGGPVGLSAGWRWIDVAGDGRDAPKLMFRGPQVGLSLRF